MTQQFRLANIRAASLALLAKMQPRAVLDNRFVSTVMAGGLLTLSALSYSTERRLRLLVTATRRIETTGLRKIATRMLRPWLQPGRAEVWRKNKIGWARYYDAEHDITKNKALSTSLLLKEPGPNGEKGVLYCSFEYNWMKLIANHDARNLLKDYLLVGASSWSPSDHSVLASLCGLSDDPAFIGISNISDISQYSMFSPGIYPLPILAADWVDPDDFHPTPHTDRSIDIIMVSHFDKWKRHWLLFEALRSMRHDLNVVLIGRHINGRTELVLQDEAKAMGVPQKLTILRNLEIQEVMRLQCDAKISVSFSKREGSCVAVTESMFADTPVAIMNDAHIGSRAYINPQTGKVVSRKQLAASLSGMIENSASFSPRAWALDNISAQQTSSKLNEILKQYSTGSGQPWTRDIASMCWRYVPRYLNPIDEMRLRPGVEYLRRQHGIELAEFVSEKQALLRKAS